METENGVLIEVTVPEWFDEKLNKLIAEYSRAGVNKTKAELIIKLAQIGYLNRDK
jgi:hypothetical protein